MSHFTVGVIVPAEGEVDEHIERLLAPYDEKAQVDPYESTTDLDWFKTPTNGLTAESTDEEALAVYRAKYPMDESDPEYYYLNADGKIAYKTRYNPKSKWDWYQIGGRWSGKFGDSDVAPTEKALDAKFFALVTPEGEWIERGKMGWWASVSNEKDQDAWDAESRTIIEKYAGHRIVNVDAHI